MAGFQNKPLIGLEQVYRFVGGLRSISELDLSQPIQLVHDAAQHVGRTIGLGATGGAAAIVAPAGAGLSDYYSATVQEIIDANDTAIVRAGMSAEPSAVDLWILGWGGAFTAGSFSQALWGIRDRTGLIKVIDNATGAGSSVVAGGASPLTSTGNYAGLQLPYLLDPRLGEIFFRVIAGGGGGCSVTMTFDILIVPKGFSAA